MKPSNLIIALLGLAFSPSFLVDNRAEAALPTAGGVYMMPMNCGELLPDSTGFTNFFEAVAHGTVGVDKNLSRRLFRILALRARVADVADSSRAPNPVDTLLQKTICFYREQKEPLKPIPFDDDAFIQFLKNSLKDLETKVDDTVYQVELEKFQRQEFERRTEKNRAIIDKIRREAGQEANQSYERLSNSAKRKVRSEQ